MPHCQPYCTICPICIANIQQPINSGSHFPQRIQRSQRRLLISLFIVSEQQTVSSSVGRRTASSDAVIGTSMWVTLSRDLRQWWGESLTWLSLYGASQIGQSPYKYHFHLLLMLFLQPNIVVCSYSIPERHGRKTPRCSTTNTVIYGGNFVTADFVPIILACSKGII